MTPPLPPGLVRSVRPSRLETWRRTEPVRLYAYSVLAALALVLVATGALTGELGHALTGLVAAVLGIVPAAEMGRASVYSPATEAERRQADSERWAELVTLRDAA